MGNDVEIPPDWACGDTCAGSLFALDVYRQVVITTQAGKTVLGSH